jgi:hypothetical protein
MEGESSPTTGAPDVVAVAARSFNMPLDALSLESRPFKVRFSPMQIAQIVLSGAAVSFIDQALAERQKG